jgi:predicted transcriptional regulator
MKQGKGLGSYQLKKARDSKLRILAAFLNPFDAKKDQSITHKILGLRPKDLEKIVNQKKPGMSSATINKHVQELVNAKILVREEEQASKEWPKPVYYKVKQTNVLIFATKYANAIGKLIALTDNITEQAEYVDCLTDYFKEGLEGILNYHKDRKNKTHAVQDTLFILSLFLQPIEPSIQSFILRNER